MTVYWLLDLDIDGRVYRLADVDLDIDCDDGSVLHYTGGLEVEPVAEVLSVLSASASQPEAQVRIWLDGVSTLAVLRARGELSRWVDGTTYERRRRVLRGPCQSPVMDSPEEGCATTIAQDPWLDPEMLISSTEVVSTATWSTASTLLDDGQEIAYPIVIGRPGRRANGWCAAMVVPRLDATLGSPAAITPNYNGVAYLLAKHHVSATRVRLCTETDLQGIIAHVINTYDDVGQPVAICPWFWSSTADPVVLAYDAAETYQFTGGAGEYGVGEGSGAIAAYNDDANQPAIYAALEDLVDASSGGLQVGGELLRGAGSVMGWALAFSGASVDRLRMVEAQRALDVYQIDTVIAARESSKPWDWVSNVLLPILPCALAAGPDGCFAVPLLLDAIEADAEARLDTRRPDVGTVGSLEWDTSQLVRSVTVRYDYDVRTGTYLSKVVYGSAAAALADPTGATRPHPALTLAAGWDLVGEDLVVDTAALYDAASADLTAYNIARIRGLPTGMLTFDVPEDDDLFFRLRRGSIVYCYDEAKGVDRVGRVVRIRTDGDGYLLVTAWFVLDPARDASL